MITDAEAAKVRQGKLQILKVTKHSSQKKLAAEGAWYHLDWTEEHIGVTMSTLDKQGRWMGDRSKYQTLPLDSSITELANIIVEDKRTRPEVW